MSEGTSYVEETSENGTDFSADDSGTVEEMPEDTILSRQTSVNLVPFLGQRFVSQDAAYEFYCSFAKQCGFSIRRHRTRGKDGVGRGITRRDFTCHRGGFPQIKPPEDGKLQRNRRSSRCGCPAYMRIVKKADFDVPEWRITGFSNIHNHELLKSNEVRLLPAYCTISSDDKSRICMFAKAGMSVRQMLRLMELEKGLKLGCLPFTEIDVRNLLQSFRNIDRDNDAIDLLIMCKNTKDDDPNFRYEFKIDAHNRLEHIAWSYASSVESYEDYGDAVVFDTTHRLEAYDMLFGIWIGVDNHGSNTFFGCVLLRDESMDSFSWALKTFLVFMKGKAPKTILTDQNMWLKDAVSVEMPNTKHAFCIWHILAKFSDWFSVQLGSKYDDWKAEFHRLYNLNNVNEFEVGWREMINTYGLQGNKHILGLYTLRTYWALAFLRSHFFAGMTSPLQAESINSYIQRILSSQSQLDGLVEQVSIVVDKQKTERKLEKVNLKTGSPIESHAGTVLTPYAFSKLQEELVLAPQYASFPIDEGCFAVRHHTQVDGGGYKVIWVPGKELLSCSCQLLEFSGFVCRHILRVLSTTNCFHIPQLYLPTRWREVSPSKARLQGLHSMVSALVNESVETDERLEFTCEQLSVALSHIKDFPHGSTTEIAYDSTSDSLILPEVEDSESFSAENFHGKNGGECGRKKRRFSVGQYGPIIEGDGLNGDGLGFL